MEKILIDFQTGFYRTFIEGDRYKTFLNGFSTTILIAFLATLIGVTIGIIVAIIKVYNYRTGKLKKLNTLIGVYLTIFRGTPIVVQLMFWYFVILTNVQSGVVVAILGFGINSGAYVAEIVRAGILAVDKGQTEAGRSLGMSEAATMWHVVLPQAIKNILPALFNEFITLFKETSVAGYIAVIDLTKAADLIRSRTMQAFFPLFSVAIIYLVFVIGLTYIQGLIERRLRRSDRR